ncbi:MAG: A/G-specific adenine glycosylase [Proteobacteria bacterium]|nr:A/G-specific adenine glycosylase [Pseudomonadota bacterium]MBU4470988.1 A/G-specific adenine glycosylase [Pseudomonadota bacterium]MCG2753588.1 A/G-specific adenine glycosylase [Desulfobacteraceae bacterium]
MDQPSRMDQNDTVIQKNLARKLLAWYRKNKRDLPWRNTHDPYAIWVSEIMLQQTRVDTVIPYYDRFLKTFPSVESLAQSPLSTVLKTWENLGYYSRARHLHNAAKILVDRFECKIPDDPHELLKLPGIGAYTAGAIASIAYGRTVPAVDGNVRRILCRVFAIRDSVGNPDVLKVLESKAGSLVPEKTPGDFNSALMDLGATLCRPKVPLCPSCPLETLCQARVLGLENELPVVEKRGKIPHRHGVCAVIFDDKRRLLVVQRPSTGLLASLWKLPGGFSLDKKDMAGDLVREVKKELDIDIRTGKKLGSMDHAYTHFRLTLFAYEALWIKDSPSGAPIICHGCQDFRWASAKDLEALAFSKVDRMILSHLS